MSLIVFPTITNDDGSGQTGTPMDATFWASIKSSIEAVTHSTTNPTLDPNETTDEVTTARGSKTSLDARLDVALNEDGTVKPISGQATESQLKQTMSGINLFRDPKIDGWLGGAAQNYVLTGAGATQAQTGEGQGDTERKIGRFAAKVTFGSATAQFYQDVVAAADWTQWDFIEGEKVVAIVYLKTSVVNKARLFIDDGTLISNSAYHSGDNTWQRFEVVHTVSGSGSRLRIGAQLEGAGFMYVSGFGSMLTDFAPTRFPPEFGLSSSFLVLSADAQLSNERVLAPSDGLQVVDAGAGGFYTLRQAYAVGRPAYSDDFGYYFATAIGTTAVSFGHWSGVNTGSGTISTPTDGDLDLAHPGLLKAITGTTPGSICDIRSGAWRAPGTLRRHVFIVKAQTGTTAMRFVCGLIRFTGVADDETARGIYFSFQPGLNTNWRAVTRGAASVTQTNTDISYSAGAWYKLEIVISEDNATVTFFINGVLKATHTTNIPADSTDLYLTLFRLVTTDAATKTIYWDYYGSEAEAQGR